MANRLSPSGYLELRNVCTPDGQYLLTLSALVRGQLVGSTVGTLKDYHYHLVQLVQQHKNCLESLVALHRLTGWTWSPDPHGYIVYTSRWAIHLRIPDLAHELTAALARRRPARAQAVVEGRIRVDLEDAQGRPQLRYHPDRERIREATAPGQRPSALPKALTGCQVLRYEDGWLLRREERHDGAHCHLQTRIWISDRRVAWLRDRCLRPV